MSELAKTRLSQLPGSNWRPAVYEPVNNSSDSAALGADIFQSWKVSEATMHAAPLDTTAGGHR